jgi:tetratricopeptide (TPR) repeat protein
MPEAGDKTSQSKRLVAEALIQVNNNEIERALETLALAVDTDPTNAGAYRHRGLLRAKRDDLDGAIADFDKAIWLFPDNAHTYYLRGLAWERKGDQKRASEDYNRALANNPEHLKAKEKLNLGSDRVHLKPVTVKASLDPIPPTSSSPALTSAPKSPTTVADEWRFWSGAVAVAIVVGAATWIYFRLNTDPVAQTDTFSQNASALQMPTPVPPRKIEAVVSPSVWRTKALKDGLTDEIRLRATAEAKSDQTKYAFDFTCDAKGEHLEISTFSLDEDAKRIPFQSIDRINSRFIADVVLRLDSGKVLQGVLYKGDYYNAGTVSNTFNESPLVSAHRLVIASIFQNDQVALAVDFAEQFRFECDQLTSAHRRELNLEKQTSQAIAQLINIQETVRKHFHKRFEYDHSLLDSEYRGVSNELSSQYPELQEYLQKGVLTNAFGGTIAVTPINIGGRTDAGFVVAFASIPSKACSSMAHAGHEYPNYQWLLQTVIDRKFAFPNNNNLQGYISDSDAERVCGGSNVVTTIEWQFN